MRKYKFTGETMMYGEVKLKQIIRIDDGLIGGWIEKEENLSQKDDCFVFDNAKVFGKAEVYGNAGIYGNVEVCDNAKICGNSELYNNAEVYGNAKVHDNARVYGNSKIFGNAIISGNSEIYGNARVSENSIIYGNAAVYGNAIIYGNASLSHGNIIGEVQKEFDNVEFYQASNTRLVTAITKDNKTLFNVGCQKLITKEEFINRIHNENCGVEENPHRKFYLKILELY